jgi:hypothetical protein
MVHTIGNKGGSGQVRTIPFFTRMSSMAVAPNSFCTIANYDLKMGRVEKVLCLVIIFPFFAFCHCLVFVYASNISGASTFLPCCSDKIRFKRVVFPLPKNPVSIVTGIRGSNGFSEDAAGDSTDRDDTLRNPILRMRSRLCLGCTNHPLSKFERLILK